MLAVRRRHAARDVCFGILRLARRQRELRREPGVLLRLVGEAREPQPDAVGPEAVGGDDIGANREVILVHRAHLVGRLPHRGRRPGTEVALVGDPVGEIDLAALKLRPGGAIEEQTLSGPETFGDVAAHLAISPCYRCTAPSTTKGYAAPGTRFYESPGSTAAH